jgi:hypothetical protein
MSVYILRYGCNHLGLRNKYDYLSDWLQQRFSNLKRQALENNYNANWQLIYEGMTNIQL